MVVLGLGRLGDVRILPRLLELLQDDEVSGHAIVALGLLKSSAAREPLEPFLNHPRAWVRKEARKAIGRIDTATRRVPRR